MAVSVALHAILDTETANEEDYQKTLETLGTDVPNGRAYLLRERKRDAESRAVARKALLNVALKYDIQRS